MTYQALNERSVPDFVAGRPNLTAVLGAGAPVEVSEIGDGNLNLVFVVRNRDEPSRALILKQALPYLRVAGESWPLTRDRMRIETEALLLYQEVVPDFAPRVFDHDRDLSFVAMEYLGEHEIMRRPLMAGASLPLVARHLGLFMARLHFGTSDLALSGPTKKARVAFFMNPSLCELQEDFVFTNPFMTSPENRWNSALDEDVRRLREDGQLKIAIAEVKAGYMTRAQALLHGDLHTGSVMVTATDTRVIDPEFSFYGPIGYDIGTLLANLAIVHLAHEVHTPDPAARQVYRHDLEALMTDVWTIFATEFDRLWQEEGAGDLVPAGYWAFPGGADAFATFRRRYLHDLLIDSAGYGACEILRRLAGIVTVPELACIDDTEARARVERAAIAVARTWILGRSDVLDIDDLVRPVSEAAGR